MLKKMFLSVLLLILGVIALGNFGPARAATPPALETKDVFEDNLGSYTAAQFRAGLPSIKLAVTVNTVGRSVIVDKIDIVSGGQYVRSMTPVKLPYTVPRDLKDERIDLADIVFGSNYDLQAGNYEVQIVIEARVDEAAASTTTVVYKFNIVSSSNYDYYGYDGPTSVSDAVGCSASGLSVFGVLALAGLALSRRRRP